MSPETGRDIDGAKQEAFVGKVLSDSSATMTTMLAVLGDRLGLFKAMADGEATTADALAGRLDLNPRYVREWLGGMATAGYVEFDPESSTFRMPLEHAAALADEGGPVFFGGVYEMLPACVGVLDGVEAAFRQGGGVKQKEYDSRIWDGLERFTAGWFENLLAPVWIPSMPAVQEKLQKGARVADVGCGRGRALIKLAQEFPNSRYVGYDAFEPTIEHANAKAAEAGVGEIVRFEHLDVAQGIPDNFDVVTTFDVVHDAVDPLGLLKSIRKALPDGGSYVCLDMNCSHNLEENAGPLGAMFHGFSVFYCMTTSLAWNGAGLGTLGFHENKVRELCDEAGFSDVRLVEMDNPFNKLYEVTAIAAGTAAADRITPPASCSGSPRSASRRRSARREMCSTSGARGGRPRPR